MFCIQFLIFIWKHIIPMLGFCICIGHCKNVLYLNVGHKIGFSFLGFMQYLNMGCKMGILLEGNATPTCGSQNKRLSFWGSCNTQIWVCVNGCWIFTIFKNVALRSCGCYNWIEVFIQFGRPGNLVNYNTRFKWKNKIFVVEIQVYGIKLNIILQLFLIISLISYEVTCQSFLEKIAINILIFHFQP
jgi:hypothetical protein